ncbi:MAG: dihydroneopterin aldolase [Chitinophagaceae bacterium]|nr:dihydroneopterin aldolase [Chitinophagaceae bacterium]
MFTISLLNILLDAPIGLYPEEHVLQNQFSVDIEVQVKNYSEKLFVDYTLLNAIVKRRFDSDEKILESLALHIYSDTKNEFPFVEKIKIVIRKLHPPMPGSVGCAQVVFEK